MPMATGRLVVVWKIPDRLRDDVIVLSFLSPTDEESLRRTIGNRVIPGRTVAARFRCVAIEAFDAVCRRLAATPDSNGTTLRSALQRGKACSSWWLHPLSARQAWGAPLLEWLLAVLTIDECATNHGVAVVDTRGAPRPVVEEFRRKFRVRSTQAVTPVTLVKGLSFAIRGRWNVWRSTLRVTRDAPWPVISPRARPLVALTAAWGLWLRWDDRQSALVDTHFRGLGAALAHHGLSTVRLVWLPAAQLSAESSWRKPFGSGDAVVLQRFLEAREVERAVLSFRELGIYWRWTRRPEFRDAFQVRRLDVYPIFRFALAYGFINSQMPLGRLFAAATERACNALRPAALIGHFEHGPHHEGVRRCRYAPVSWTMQHSPNTARAI
jgi:hypothetical protein